MSAASAAAAAASAAAASSTVASAAVARRAHSSRPRVEVNCRCGVTIQGDSVPEVIRLTQSHDETCPTKTKDQNR